MIPEREQEALMRLTMCAREECSMCKYKYTCDFAFRFETATRCMNILADALRKTENCSEKPNNCDTCRNKGFEGCEQPCLGCGCCGLYEPKDEPQTDCGDFADRLAYERGVKHAWEVAQKVFNSTVTFYEAEDLAKQIDKDINVRSKDEPQTDIHDLTDCDFCKDRNCKDCEGGKDEPQTETEIAKAIVHKMIDDAVIAEDAYPDLRQKMHDAVDEYEPLTGTDLKEVCREEDDEFTDRLIEEQLANKLLTDCAWK